MFIEFSTNLVYRTVHLFSVTRFVTWYTDSASAAIFIQQNYVPTLEVESGGDVSVTGICKWECIKLSKTKGVTILVKVHLHMYRSGFTISGWIFSYSLHVIFFQRCVPGFIDLRQKNMTDSDVLLFQQIFLEINQIETNNFLYVVYIHCGHTFSINTYHLLTFLNNSFQFANTKELACNT